MQYGDAFRRLGYTLEVPRQDWTAASETGVCLTLWHSEIDWKGRPLTMDTHLHAGPRAEWAPAGNNKRIRHLTTAIERDGGWVDAVVVKGVPGRGVDSAEPWDVAVRKSMRWHVRNLDTETGHFIAEALPYS